MSTRRALLAALGGLALRPAWAAADPGADLLREVRQRLAAEPVIRGQFEQRKSVRGFRHAIVSQGEFLVARDRGVVWRTTSPFPSTLVVTRDRLVARNPDGTVARQLSAAEEPALRAVNEVLFALMTADTAVIGTRFRVAGELAGTGGWKLVLLPREAALARWIVRVDLEGDRFVRTVRLHEASEDFTQIRLSQQAAAAALSAHEESQIE